MGVVGCHHGSGGEGEPRLVARSASTGSLMAGFVGGCTSAGRGRRGAWRRGPSQSLGRARYVLVQVQVRVSVSEVRTGTEALRRGETWFRVSEPARRLPLWKPSATLGKRTRNVEQVAAALTPPRPSVRALCPPAYDGLARPRTHNLVAQSQSHEQRDGSPRPP